MAPEESHVALGGIPVSPKMVYKNQNCLTESLERILGVSCLGRSSEALGAISGAPWWHPGGTWLGYVKSRFTTLNSGFTT